VRNQRGVTLIELLVTITVMGIISTPIFMLVNNTLQVHQDTSIRNQLQHEARFISQFMSEKVRDGAIIDRSGSTWKLKKGNQTFITYDEIAKKVYFKGGATVLSSNIVEFDVGDGTDTEKIDVRLSLEDQGRTFNTNTTIYYDPMKRYSVEENSN
jgi:prepilin-type N-terminal cleavage/methylation domain-containing protein